MGVLLDKPDIGLVGRLGNQSDKFIDGCIDFVQFARGEGFGLTESDEEFDGDFNSLGAIASAVRGGGVGVRAFVGAFQKAAGSGDAVSMGSLNGDNLASSRCSGTEVFVNLGHGFMVQDAYGLRQVLLRETVP